MEVCYVLEVEGHHPVIPLTDISVRGVAAAIGLDFARWLYPLDHFEYVSHFGRVKRGSRKDASILLAIFQSEFTNMSLFDISAVGVFPHRGGSR